MSDLYGNTGPVELPEARAWDPRGGWQIVKKYRGAIGYLDPIMEQALENGLRFQYDPEEPGGYALLQVFYGAESTQSTTEPLSDVWSLVGNDMEKTIWTIPKVAAMMDRIAASTKSTTHTGPQMAAFVRRWAELMAKGTYSDTNELGETLPLSLVTLAQMVELLTGFVEDGRMIVQVVSEMARGVESWLVSQYVLRHTLVIARNYSIKPAYTYVNKVMSTAALVTYESVPNDLKFGLPEGWWLVRTPTVEQTGADKWTINQEWWHADSYSPLIYEAVG